MTPIDPAASRAVTAAMALAAAGYLSQAEAGLREALARAPHEASIVAGLARVLLTANRPGEALGAIDACEVPPPAALLLLRAQILLSMGRATDAVPAFRAAIAAAPELGAAEAGLATALGASGAATAASEAARRAIGKGADSPATRYVLGRSLFETGSAEEAEREFRMVLRFDPAHAAAHASLAESIWMRTGDLTAATVMLDRAIDRQPAAAALRMARAKLLESSGRPSEALDELEAALLAAPANAMLRLAAAQAAVAVDPGRAVAHAANLMQTAPGNATAAGAYAHALMAHGQIADAARVASELHRAHPDNGQAIALLSTVWRLLGDPRYSELCDYARSVRAETIDTPNGWASLSAYLADLAGALRRVHRLNAHPVHQTLRAGTQVDHHFDHQPEPAIAAFAQAVDGPIRRYILALGHGPDVLRRRNQGGYRFSGLWSVRLRQQGFHVNHFHGKGWLSSACYIQLPPGMDTRGGEGWLKFGEPGIPLTTSLDADYYVRPEPGLLVLFPSWMWHGTVPFSGDDTAVRSTMAFDLVPAPGR